MADSYRFTAGDNELDDFDYDEDHIDMQSEVGAYGGDDEEDETAHRAPAAVPAPTPATEHAPASQPPASGGGGAEGAPQKNPAPKASDAGATSDPGAKARAD